MASKLGILGLAAGLLLAGPGIADAHGHHSEGRNVRQGAHRHARNVERQHAQEHRRHHVRHPRRADRLRHHRHLRSHERRGARFVVHGSYWCDRCRHSFREQARFFRHLRQHHRLHRDRLWSQLVRTWWGWAFYG
jgi:hypothetical protein